MSTKKKYRKDPPAPAQPENYILVKTKEGSYWRKKRGIVKKTKLNAAFEKNMKLAGTSSQAAKNLLVKLQPFLHGLQMGRFIAPVSGRLRKSFNKNNRFDFSFMKDYDMQPYHVFSKLFQDFITIEEKKDELLITIPIQPLVVRQYSRLATHYYFDAVLLYGDPVKKNSLRTVCETSSLYAFDKNSETSCRLCVALPAKKYTWMLLVKLSCLEGRELAIHPKYYGMKVMKVG